MSLQVRSLGEKIDRNNIQHVLPFYFYSMSLKNLNLQTTTTTTTMTTTATKSGTSGSHGGAVGGGGTTTSSTSSWNNNNNNNKVGYGSGRYVTTVLVMTVIAHSIIFSLSSLNRNNSKDMVVSSSNNNMMTFDYSSSTASGGGLSLRSSSSSSSQQEQQQQQQQQLPHWRIATDCSVYSLDCFTRRVRENRYKPYPFPTTTTTNNITKLDGQLSNEWKQRLLDRHVPVTNYTSDDTSSLDHYQYPPQVSTAQYQQCMSSIQDKTTMEQLDTLLETKTITPEPHTNMVSFTISDYSYTHDMIHDMYQMMTAVVGFSSQHFFLLAIDNITVELACQYGYPVIYWNQKDNLRDAVANTKVMTVCRMMKVMYMYREVHVHVDLQSTIYSILFYFFFFSIDLFFCS